MGALFLTFTAMQGYLLFALLVPLATAPIHFPGNCPDTPALENCDLPAFTSSIWYEHSKYTAKLENGYDCIKWTFAPGSGEVRARVDMRNTFWKQDTYMKDTLTPTSNANICDYDYVCTSMPVTHLPLPGTYPYKIIATDNNKFAANNKFVVAWSCQNSGDGHDEILWILTKERNSAAAVTAKTAALAALKALKPTPFLCTNPTSAILTSLVVLVMKKAFELLMEHQPSKSLSKNKNQEKHHRIAYETKGPKSLT